MSGRNYLEDELEILIRTDPQVWRFIRTSSLDGVWYWDLVEPENEYMSPEFWRLFGFDPAMKKHLASEWQDLIHPDDLEVAKQNLAAHLGDPEHPYDQIVRYKRADGGTAWVRCRGIAIRDADGKPTRLLGAHNDMTELKLEERAAKNTSDLLTRIMDTTQSAIIGFDGRGEIASINAAGRRMLGDCADAASFPWPDEIMFLDMATLEPLEAPINPIRQSLNGAALSGETWLMARRTSDDRRYVRVSSAPVGDEDAALSCVVILDDVTEQERNRQKIERTGRLDALGQLTGGIAHDFNNLLATVQYALQLAQEAQDDQRRDDYLRTALQSVERGSDLTKRLLTFAKQQPVSAKSLSASEVLAEFQQLAAPLIERNIATEFRIVDERLRVHCDPAQLINALLNLVLNARDAILRSGAGSRITVEVRRAGKIASDIATRREAGDLGQKMGQGSHGAGPSGLIEFSVADNGPGMSDEVKHRAIDPFFTLKGNNSGAGLGLSMVYGFAQQSSGELRIDSRLDRGTTVSLILPESAEPDDATRAVQPGSEVKQRNATILIVEDEVGLLLMMHDLIASLGYDVLAARSAQDALELIEAEDAFDLLLTDIVMPGDMNGFDLAGKVRQMHPRIPVLFMSGYAGYTKADMSAIDAPMLQKPCPPAELSKAIAAALSKARQAP